MRRQPKEAKPWAKRNVICVAFVAWVILALALRTKMVSLPLELFTFANLNTFYSPMGVPPDNPTGAYGFERFLQHSRNPTEVAAYATCLESRFGSPFEAMWGALMDLYAHNPAADAAFQFEAFLAAMANYTASHPFNPDVLTPPEMQMALEQAEQGLTYAMAFAGYSPSNKDFGMSVVQMRINGVRAAGGLPPAEYIAKGRSDNSGLILSTYNTTSAALGYMVMYLTKRWWNPCNGAPCLHLTSMSP